VSYPEKHYRYHVVQRLGPGQNGPALAIDNSLVSTRLAARRFAAAENATFLVVDLQERKTVYVAHP
jgi:hypothetical protein